ncbi:MAG: glycosyltransferase family 39 protein [Actinomycetota bacterium]|nr:glycosyltransferase family 39 protein [Actinomycetota bacterium]
MLSVRRIGPVAAVLAIAFLARLAYGVGDIGYDASYAMLWGHELADGRMPDYDHPGSPTPHPLANLASVPVSLLGEGAWEAMVAITFVALGALVWGAYRLGSEIFSPPVGALFALILGTRPLLVNETLEAFVDVPFLALIVWGAVLEVRRPRRGMAVLLLVAAAGLLRPEGWLFAGAYGLYLMLGAGWRERLRVAGLVAIAPVVWALTDLAVEGDPLFSLHGTQRIAEEVFRPRGLENAVTALPEFLEAVLRTPLLVGGLAGIVLGMWLLYERSLIPAAITAVGMATFVALGIADLPLLSRYVLPSAIGLALFAALVLGGPGHASGRLRTAWIAGGAVLAVLVALDVPATYDLIEQQRSLTGDRHALHDDLRELARAGPVRAAATACPPVVVEDARMLPHVAVALERDPTRVHRRGRRAPRRGTFLRPRNAGVARLYQLGPARYVDRRLATARTFQRRQLGAPPGFREVALNESWAVYSSC